jgi:hypothetical protein
MRSVGLTDGAWRRADLRRSVLDEAFQDVTEPLVSCGLPPGIRTRLGDVSRSSTAFEASAVNLNSAGARLNAPLINGTDRR